jgi:hypothetical protein
MRKVNYDVGGGVGNAGQVGIYDFKVSGKLKNWATRLGRYLRCRHGIIHFAKVLIINPKTSEVCLTSEVWEQ